MTRRIERDTSWMSEAACVGKDPELFYRSHDTDEALAVCDDCPVKSECLDFALESGEEWGVWGALTEDERRKIKRHRNRNAMGNSALRTTLRSAS